LSLHSGKFWTWEIEIQGCYAHRDVSSAGTCSGTKRPWDGSSRHCSIHGDNMSSKQSWLRPGSC
jgi:hypothetical protein